jgi:hypothetical protein
MSLVAGFLCIEETEVLALLMMIPRKLMLALVNLEQKDMRSVVHGVDDASFQPAALAEYYAASILYQLRSPPLPKLSPGLQCTDQPL